MKKYKFPPFTDNRNSIKIKGIKEMKATGIVRRIDDLGRVVVPKEIRKTLRIREGDPLEIFTDREGEIILKKYSPMGEMVGFARQYAESLAGVLGCTVCITDQDQVVAAAGGGKKELLDQAVSKEVLAIMDQRQIHMATKGEKNYAPVTKEGESGYIHQLVAPIISDSDVIGSVILLDKKEKKKFGEIEQKVAGCAARFLGGQMEA